MSPLFVLLFYAALSLATFWKLLFTFFQQDEWAIFGNFIVWDKANLNWFDRLFIYEQDTHIIPLSNLFSYIQYKIAGLNFTIYAVDSIVLHSINSFLVFKLSELMTKNKKISLLAGVLFLTNSITQQATTWVATTIGTSTSTLFILLSFLFFIKFLLEKNKWIHLLLSYIFFAVSLLFKETSIFCFLFFPILWFFYGKGNKRLFVKIFSVLGVFGIGYVMFRVYFLLYGYTSTSAPSELSQPEILVYFYRLITSPLKFVTQSIIPTNYIINISSMILSLGYPFLSSGNIPNPYIVESVGSDIVSYFFAFLILGISALFYIKHKDGKTLRELIPVSLLFIVLSSLPFILIPGKSGYFSLLDGRHLYLTSVFSSILLSILFFNIYSYFNKKAAWVIVVIIAVFIGINMLKIRKDLNIQQANAYVRTYVLDSIIATYPHLPEKAIFYTESDKSYYGLPVEERILPFQSGLGQALLVWYNSHGEEFPACFFTAKYLYVLLAQDYKECEGRGFGYYRNFDLLKTAVKLNKLSAENVFAFRFNSNTNNLENITQETRNKINK